MTVLLVFAPLAKYAQFKGRSRRSEFWLWLLLCLFIGGAMVVLPPALASRLSSTSFAKADNAIAGHAIDLLRTVVGLSLLLPSVAVTVRRMHDLGRSGWIILWPVAVFAAGMALFTAISSLLTIKMNMAHPDSPSGGEGLGTVSGIVVAFAICMILPMLIVSAIMLNFFTNAGTQGPNRFGADPRDIA
jgi:uncharacterized membrane protein YhaH (DUF805 family)